MDHFSIVVPNAEANVTDTFGPHIGIVAQTKASEVSLIDFDIQNELNSTAVMSGLNTTFHTQFGIAGVEDVIVSTNATLVALDIEAELVFCSICICINRSVL